MIDTKQIREHMEVKSSDCQHVGVVDHMDGQDRIKLTRNDPTHEAHHHFIPVDWVDHIDEHVHLSKTQTDVKAHWSHAGK